MNPPEIVSLVKSATYVGVRAIEEIKLLDDVPTGHLVDETVEGVREYLSSNMRRADTPFRMHYVLVEGGERRDVELQLCGYGAEQAPYVVVGDPKFRPTVPAYFNSYTLEQFADSVVADELLAHGALHNMFRGLALLQRFSPRNDGVLIDRSLDAYVTAEDVSVFQEQLMRTRALTASLRLHKKRIHS